jgi:hypothetical protein
MTVILNRIFSKETTRIPHQQSVSKAASLSNE